MSKSQKLQVTVNRRGVVVACAAGVLIALITAGVYIASLRRLDVQAAMEGPTVDVLRTGWEYMPGTSPENAGLRVGYLGRAIVQQNGTGGQANPPVNLYGTYLRVKGDFEMQAELGDISGVASLRFYSSPPVVKDEFRVEPKSFRIALNSTSATVERWDEYAGQELAMQEPSFTRSRAFTARAMNMVTVKRQQGTIDVTVNGTRIASFPEEELFDTGTLWLGLDAGSTGSGWKLASLRAGGRVEAASTQNTPIAAKQSSGLQSIASARRPDFLLGAAVALGPLVSDAAYARLALGGNFGQVTMENELKWQFIHPQKSIYDFRDADAVMEIASKNQLKVHGHTLVFGEANPQWVQNLSRENAQAAMVDHISTAVGRYKGKMMSWDVVNEPVSEDGTGLREHVWLRAMGEDYIRLAFEAARKADPDAKLYINEYGLEADGERWDTFLALITRLKNEGVPIDGVGLQAHIYTMEEDMIDPSTLRLHIQALARLGLSVRISEIDVDSRAGTDVQAQQYADVLGACLAEANCVSWSTWGVTDVYNLWQDSDQVLQNGKDLLWDDRYKPTPAVKSIVEVLSIR